MRLDSKVSAATRIEVVTEGVLLRMLRDDPTLEGVGLLIFDEFHERSLDADLGLALALYARETFADENHCKIILMSATLDEAELAAFMHSRCIRSAGRMYPVEQHYGQASQPRDRISDRVLKTLEQAVQRHSQSSFLVFLPGQGEIRQVADQFDAPADVSVYPLYGDLDLAQQQRAIEPCPTGKRKVVLATNIAETSLTIDGVDVVIDAGLQRVPVFDPNSGMSRLQTARISQASSEQRKGRAGRLRPGTCYRLWSESQQQQLIPQQAPEIQNADLASLALQLFAWGIYDPAELRWLTPPPAGAYQQALELLLGLGALARSQRGIELTAHGSAMAELPTHPRLAHMLLAGQAIGEGETAADMAAVLSDRDPLSRETPDMRLRLEYLSGEIDCPAPYRGWLHRTRKLAEQFAYQLPARNVTPLQRPAKQQVPAYLIACAYPDRIARARHAGGFQLANGRSCQFESPSPMSKAKWLAVAEVGGAAKRRGDSIRSAAPLDPALFETLLADSISTVAQVDWDGKTGRFIAERQRRCGALLLSRETLDDIADEDRIGKLIELIRTADMSNLGWTDGVNDFVHRARLMQNLESDWPSFESKDLTASLEDWLAPFLMPVRKISHLRQLDLLAALKARLSWPQLQALETALPERLAVPSGSQVKIDYRQNPPVLAVKLQEMFGCEDTPAVAGGRIPLVVHLLSPAGRPLQVTQDLAGFWRSSYTAVKKEMKGRYPKHPWPDDPLSAEATRYTKRRSS
jgi:ATP-dependent helicase HrpB